MSFINAQETNIFRIVASVRALWQGRSIAGGSFTLRANETTTDVVAPNCGAQSRVFITPRTANAAGALATTYIDPNNVAQGAFTVTHANAVSTDREFSYEIRG